MYDCSESHHLMNWQLRLQLMNMKHMIQIASVPCERETFVKPTPLPCVVLNSHIVGRKKKTLVNKL